MKIEKIDRVVVDVKNLDEAVALFSNLFGITFNIIPSSKSKSTQRLTDHADRSSEEAKHSIAISPIGLELIQTIPALEREGLRSFCFKVPNLEQAIAEMKEKGIRLLKEIWVGDLKEAIFSPEDLHGVRLALSEYETNTAVNATEK